jgi:hypothetical protein
MQSCISQSFAMVVRLLHTMNKVVTVSTAQNLHKMDNGCQLCKPQTNKRFHHQGIA